MKHKVGWKVASLIGILITAFVLTGFGTAATYDSMKSYEDLLRSQTTLIGSFENLLKNSTLQDTGYNYHYKFLDSFDDLADREQQGLSSFEDLVSFNWSTLSETEKISLSQSFEDLIRRESTVLSSNEALLKRGFCAINNSTQQKELLDRFEARLKYEVVLYTKFEDWLHFQQMIEVNQTEEPAWIGFLNSYEDLIRRQSNLLSSFEMLLKIRCDGKYLTLTKSILSQNGNDVTYHYHIIVANQTANITVTDSMLGVVKTYRLVPAGVIDFDSARVTLTCGDCDNCTCKVCNFATVCGEVVTPNGNFTTCSVSNQYCVTVNDYPHVIHPIVYPGVKVEDFQGGEAANAIAENNSMAANLPENAPCPTCSGH